MNIVLFDTSERKYLYPFTQTRAIADIRLGIFTIREFWENYFDQKINVLTENYLHNGTANPISNNVLLINAALIPSTSFFLHLTQLGQDEVIVQDEIVLAAKTNQFDSWTFDDILPAKFSTKKELPETVSLLKFPWQLFQLNNEAIKRDYALITKEKKSKKISAANSLIAPENIFAEEGARIEHTTINAGTGPVYIGKNCEVMEGCIIRGPFAMLEGSVLKMGTKIYGATTLGPFCTAGGEIKNSILFGYSNKAHDGYLGDAVIGEWCNLGAGTSNSNIKNTGGLVNVWSKKENTYLTAGNKCGLMMGDYTRSAINSSFNTGTITGVCSNIFGSGLLPNYIPDFSWGTTNKNPYDLEKAFSDIQNWKQLKNQSITAYEKDILTHIFAQLK
ncbi:MAG: glucose-1-phosphate thymidylyltransferase [Sphingobacteriales bacterium]|nr:glucose-1-phosphate thymidylyltransferase [Sphingobacteriales bacterium]